MSVEGENPRPTESGLSHDLEDLNDTLRFSVWSSYAIPITTSLDRDHYAGISIEDGTRSVKDTIPRT